MLIESSFMNFGVNYLNLQPHLSNGTSLDTMPPKSSLTSSHTTWARFWRGFKFPNPTKKREILKFAWSY